MSNELNYSHDTQHFGEIELASEVLEVIAHIAANEVDGVHALKGSFSADVKALFGQESYQSGVHLSNEQDGINIDVFCNFKYGVNVPEVALAIQEHVYDQVYQMTNIQLSEVNVHVLSVVPEKHLNDGLFHKKVKDD